jgi:thioredoxin-related protein
VSKPVVNRLAKQLLGRAELIRVDVATPTGLAVAQMYKVRATPTLLVFDGQGNVVYSHVGIPDTGAVATVVENLRSE